LTDIAARRNSQNSKYINDLEARGVPRRPAASDEMAKMSILGWLVRQLSESHDLRLVESKEHDR
jgi:hypothetical protein